MADFSRKFRVDRLTETVLQENSWFTDLLRRWYPAGDAVTSSLGDGTGLLARDRVKNKGEMQHLRVAFRDEYMNFYCGGHSIAKVEFVRGELQAKIHEKYVYGCECTGKKYVKLTSKGFREPGKAQLVPYGDRHLKKWIENANSKIDMEKRFVDLVVAHNSDVIDLEMGLPAYSNIPKERRAPRIDMVALEPCEGRWRVALWEAKLVGDGRARCRGDELPKVVDQLKRYKDWFSDNKRAESVASAYQQNCRLLVELHAIARCVRPDIEELGPGIRAVASSNATPPSIDIKPRLLIIYDKKNEPFGENGHLNKLKGTGLRVKTVESLSELALCGQS